MKKLFRRPPQMPLIPRTPSAINSIVPPSGAELPPMQPEPIGVGGTWAESNRIAITDILDIATNAWRARGKMTDVETGEVREEMKRVIRHVDAILSRLQGMGFELKDHTGDAFDYGQALKVVGTEPRASLLREEVLETMKPTIYWHGRLVQTGEVVIGTPEQGKDA